MSFLNQAINLNDLPDSESMEPVPSGVYQVVVDGAELKDTKAGTGQYINLKLKVVGGEFNQRVFFDIINISNPNATAQNIGLATLKKVMKAMRLDSVQNTDQLIGGQLVVKVGVELSEQYGDKNKVKDYQGVAPTGLGSPSIGAISMGQAPQPAPPQHPQYTQVPAQQAPAQYTQNPNFEEDLPF